MANLKNFISPNLRVNEQYKLYVVDYIQVGELVPNIIQNLHLKMTGKVKVADWELEGMVEVIMDNENATGHCTLIFNGARLEKVPYRSTRNKIYIEPVQHELTQVILTSDRGANWSMIGVNTRSTPLPIWVGAWSPAKAGTEVDFSTFPKETEAV